jgi:formylglycine-generating enzyme required for sulfatase activity
MIRHAADEVDARHVETSGHRGSGILRVAALILVIVCVPGSVACFASETQALSPGTTFRDCPDCPEMVVIPAGEFLMGTSEIEAERDLAGATGSLENWMLKTDLSYEKPKHLVQISQPFALGKFPVIRGEYTAFVKATGYLSAEGCVLGGLGYQRNRPTASWREPGFHQTDRDPVVCVRWQDANAYIAWLNDRVLPNEPQDKRVLYRLPSEAEWEYAARGGQQSARWWATISVRIMRIAITAAARGIIPLPHRLGASKSTPSACQMSLAMPGNG